jgi:glyoxylase-like metal-dependent hydrolase (beta-lactamase superfamily II)
MENFIYLIEDTASKRAAIVDPAWDVHRMLELAEKHGVTITDILLTHSHSDHINGVNKVLDKFDAELHLSQPEAEFWGAELGKPSLHYGGETIQLGETEIEMLHTPGHTPGSVCYRMDEQLITGDTMFVFGCGHCNMGGDPNILFDTLRSMKENLPATMTIHPGHNYSDKPTSTMGEQIEGNPFLHFDKRENFIEFRQHVHSRIRSTPYREVNREQAERMLKQTSS